MVYAKLIAFSLVLSSSAFAAPLTAKRESAAVTTCRNAASTVNEDIQKACGVSTGFGGPSAAQLASAGCTLASANAVPAILGACLPASGATTAPGATPKAADFGASAAAFTQGLQGSTGTTCEGVVGNAITNIIDGCGNGVFSTSPIPQGAIQNCPDGIAAGIATMLGGVCGASTASTDAAAVSSALAQEAVATQDAGNDVINSAAADISSIAAAATATAAAPPSTQTGSPAVKACQGAAFQAGQDQGKTCGVLTGFGGPSAAQLASAACKSSQTSAVTAIVASCGAALGVKAPAAATSLSAADFPQNEAAFKKGQAEAQSCFDVVDAAATVIAEGCGNGLGGQSFTPAQCADAMAQAIGSVSTGLCSA